MLIRGTRMKREVMYFAVGILCLLGGVPEATCAFGFGKSERVRLEDISVLTLHHGKMTTGRRSSPVPQLKCVGGSAANAFTPQTVQCYNRGSDGYDVQWECKTDMDNAYRFGQIEVTCEGYASSDDDYILRGSCGLEYTLEYTKEGMQNQQGGHHSYYGNDHSSYDNYYNHQKSGHRSGGSDWVFLAVVGVLIYVIYRTCLASNEHTGPTAPGTDDGYPRGTGSSWGGGGGGGSPPPPGFRSDYSSGSCGGGNQQAGAGGGAGGGPGFWTGAGMGGILGYLFGGRNRGYGYGGYGGYGGRHRYGWSAPRHNSGFSSGWGSSWGGGRSSGFGGGGSTGTRTASGFGGTRRR